MRHAGVKRTAVTATWPAVTIDSQQSHGRIDTDTDRALLQDYIEAATDYAEREQNRCLRQATWQAVWDRWPCDGIFYLPFPPLVSVQSVKYIDAGGTLQTLATSYYVLDLISEPGRIRFVQTPPQSDDRPAAIQVNYTAGHSAATLIPAVTRQAIRVLAQTWHENREAVAAGNMGQVPLSVTDLLNQNKLLNYA